MPKKPTTYEELFPGRFLKAALLQGKRATLVIKDVDMEELEGEDGKKMKVILSFEGTAMSHVCPKTNAICLKEMFGNKIADWIGKRVTLYPTTWNGEDAIRVWGSPDIGADMNIEVKLPRRKPIKMTMHKVDLKAKQSADQSQAQPPSDPSAQSAT